MATSKFYDYATGKEVHNNPEEEYRQLFEHILIDDLERTMFFNMKRGNQE